MNRFNFRSGAWLLVVALTMCVVGLFAPAPAFSLTITPEKVLEWFNPFAGLAMIVWGMLVKYWAPLAGVPNYLIRWLNAIGFIIGTTAGVEWAHASLLGDAARVGGFTFLDNVIRALVHSEVASHVYEGYGRPLLEGVFGWKKAVPRPA